MTTHDPFDPEGSREDARRDALVFSTQQADDVRRLMNEEWGRRLMWSWLEFGGVHRLSFVAGQADQTGFNEGVRNFGLMLMSSILQHAPDKYPLMQQEAKRDQALREEVESEQRVQRSWSSRVRDRLRTL